MNEQPSGNGQTFGSWCTSSRLETLSTLLPITRGRLSRNSGTTTTFSLGWSRLCAFASNTTLYVKLLQVCFPAVVENVIPAIFGKHIPIKRGHILAGWFFADSKNNQLHPQLRPLPVCLSLALDLTL
jgi:hypothetical protein